MDTEFEPQAPRSGLKRVIFLVAVAALLLVVGGWLSELRPPAFSADNEVIFEVKAGESFNTIATHLSSAGLIRSPLAFEAFSLVRGVLTSFRPGLYRLSPSMSGDAIVRALTSAQGRSVTITIPEGYNVYQIDKLLSDALIVRPGEFITAAGTKEGRLFPDTYQFLNGEGVAAILKKFGDNFDAKATPIFAGKTDRETNTIILASLLEKEVQTPADQRIVAGVLLKRLAAGMTLGVDAAVCYGKQVQNPEIIVDCSQLTTTDLKANTPYNVYIHRGLPAGPIGNPGTSTIEAALTPVSSAYWYYLSDPATGKTIFAKTLDEQNANIRRYLR